MIFMCCYKKFYPFFNRLSTKDVIQLVCIPIHYVCPRITLARLLQFSFIFYFLQVTYFGGVSYGLHPDPKIGMIVGYVAVDDIPSQIFFCENGSIDKKIK